jgi:hypothetical protein
VEPGENRHDTKPAKKNDDFTGAAIMTTPPASPYACVNSRVTPFSPPLSPTPDPAHSRVPRGCVLLTNCRLRRTHIDTKTYVMCGM